MVALSSAYDSFLYDKGAPVLEPALLLKLVSFLGAYFLSPKSWLTSGLGEELASLMTAL